MQYVAFLRAINVGGHNRVRMTDLRTLWESLGYASVATYLQTGNVVFEANEEAEAAAVRIEEGLAGLGMRGAAAVVRSAAAVQELVASDAFAAYPADAYRRYVTLLRLPAGNGTAERLAAAGLRVVRAEGLDVLCVRETGVGGADLNGLVERHCRAAATTRYWHVIEGVAGLLDGRPYF